MRSRENAWFLRVIVAITVALVALVMSCASANALAQTRVFGTTTYGYDNLASQRNVNSGDPDQDSPGDPGRVGTSASQRVIGPAPGSLPADLVLGSAIVPSIDDNNSQMFGARHLAPRAPSEGTEASLSSFQRPTIATKAGGSALADASSAAFKAADGASGWVPSAKHLAGAGGRWQKFASGADPAALAQEALRSPGATFLPDKTAGRFIVETDLGRAIGTKGETWLKVVVTDGGDIITGYPVKR